MKPNIHALAHRVRHGGLLAAATLMVAALAAGFASAAAPEAQADPYTATIQITLADLETEADLTTEQIGSGFDLVYYEIPRSVQYRLNPSGMTQEEILEAIKPYINTVHIGKQRQSLTFTMEEGATPEDPYVLYASPNLLQDSADNPWLGSFGLLYDGTNVITPYGIQQDSSGIWRSTFYIDNTPKTTVNIPVSFQETDASNFPVYVRMTLNAYNTKSRQGTLTQTQVQRIDAPGDYTLTMPQQVSTASTMDFWGEIELFSDEGCTTADTSWQETKLANKYSDTYDWSLSEMTLNEAKDGLNTWGNDEYPVLPVAFDFKKIEGMVDVTIPVHMEQAPSYVFPVYARINVNNDWNEDVGRGIGAGTWLKITEPGDYSVTLSNLLPGDGYAFTLGFYTVEGDWNSYTEGWYSDTEGVTTTFVNGGYSITDDGVLQYKDPYDDYADPHDFRLNICYDTNFDEPWLSVDFHSAEGELSYPAYLSLRLDYWDPHADYTGGRRQLYTTLKVTENGFYRVDFPRKVAGWTMQDLIDTSYWPNYDITDPSWWGLDLEEVLRSSRYAATLSYTIYSDQRLTKVDDRWNYQGSRKVYISSYDGHIANIDGLPGSVCVLAPRINTTAGVSLPVSAELPEGANDADYFPAFIEATLTPDDGSVEPMTATRQINSLDDLSDDLYFSQDDHLLTGTGYTVSWSVYTDSSKSAKHPKWSSGDVPVTLTANNTLEGYQGVFALKFCPLSVPLKADARNPSADAFPVIIRMNAADENGTELTKTATFADRGTTSVDYDFLTYAWANWSVDYAAYTDEAAHEQRSDWVAQDSGYGLVQNMSGKLVQNIASTSEKEYTAVAVWGGVTPTIDVHTVVPSDVDNAFEWTRWGYSYQNNLQIQLMRQDVDGGTVQDVDCGRIEQHLTEAGDTQWEFPQSMAPGTYYISHFNRSTQTNYRDPGWNLENRVKVELKSDGKFYKDGELYVLQNIYTKPVVPKIGLDITWAEGVTGGQVNYYISIDGVAGTTTENAGTGAQGYTSADVENVLLGYSTAERGWPVGEYTVTSWGREWGDHSSAYSESWSGDDAVHVTLREDGNFYDDNGVVYVAPLTQAGYVHKATIKVDTQVDAGLEQEAFVEGNTFKVYLYDYYFGDQTYKPIAEGTATITQAGESTVELTPYSSDGLLVGTLHSMAEQGVDEDGNLEFDRWGNPIMYRHEYRIGFGTYNGDDMLDIWSGITPETHGYGLTYAAAIARDGSIRIGDNSDWYVHEAGNEYVLHNEYLLRTRPINGEAPAIEQSEGGTLSFKPITETSQLQNKAHYMVVAQSRYDGKWYALSYNENGDTQVLLSDVTSLDDLTAGYKVAENQLNSTGYIFTASSVSQSDGSATIQLKTGIKDANNKAMAVKMGTSSTSLFPLISNSAGSLTVKGRTKVTDGASTFQIWKNTYAQMIYIGDWFGMRGFYPQGYYAARGYYRDIPSVGALYYDEDVADPHELFILEDFSNRYCNYPSGMLGKKGPYFDGRWDHVLTADPEAITPEHLAQFKAAYGYDDTDYWFYGNEVFQYDFYILSDQTDEPDEPANNTYKQVRTFGDFVNTFVDNTGTPPKSFVMVYTDEDGKDYALNPKQLTQVVTKETTAGYRTLTAGADNELIASNYSRDYNGQTSFNFATAAVAGSGEQVVTTQYGFRKSRTNNADGKEYLTLTGEDAWTASDDAAHDDGLLYVLHPTNEVHSQSDWGEETSYKLSVVRYGETTWLGVRDGQMVAVDSEDEAVTFNIYAPDVVRYYPSAASEDYATYHRITSLDDINEDDELLIVYNHDGKREIMANTPAESAYYNYYGYWSYSAIPALLVSDEYETFNTDSGDFPADLRTRFRLDTDSPDKKAYAYMANDTTIMAQGVASNAIGTAKSIKSNQRKFDSVVGIGQPGGYMWIKGAGSPIYNASKAETNFLEAGDGLFYLRGGKSDAWLGAATYHTIAVDLLTGNYTEGDERGCFTTVGTDERIAVEIYKKGAAELITVNYHDLDGAVEESAQKPEGIVTLKQGDDLAASGSGDDYIFVGWTTDKDKSGKLGLDESANLFDFDDLARVASVKDSAKEAYGLLGDCNPAVTNTTKVMKDDLDDGVLDLYPVYARKGFSQGVTADEGTTPVIGISDVKDLQGGGAGQIEDRERWLGSINLEVYVDGVLWVPGGTSIDDGSGEAAGSNSAGGASPLSVGGGYQLMANSGDSTATMYFAYHNDDAADLNLKFIADGVEDMQSYLEGDDFSATEPTGHYVIDAVYALQGGSEDGLKHMYNWMDAEHGGQLDNVQGGSTVKVYLTTRYQVKYYFDDGSGDGYKLLPFGDNSDEAYTNPNFYTTPGTKEAVDSAKAESDYVVTPDGDEATVPLIANDIGDNGKFVDDAIRRGEYSAFLYKFQDYETEFPVEALPTPPAGKELTSGTWSLRDKALAEKATQDPETTYSIQGDRYGTGNTAFAYKGSADTVPTYHLYAEVRSSTTDISITKKWSDANNQDGKRPNAGAYAKLVHLMNGDTEVSGFEPSVTDNGDGTYTVAYSGLPAADATGAAITYSVKEDTVEGYTADASSVTDGGTMTNTHTPETVAISGTKKWAGDADADGVRPSEVKVNLLADGTVIDSKTVTGGGDEWSYSFGDLPAYKDGTKIVYTVTEDTVEGYSTSIDGFTVTNTYTPGKTSVNVSKVWSDDDNRDGKQPGSVTAHLLANGADTGKTLTLSNDNKWQGSFTDLDAATETGAAIAYTVSEDDVDGYTPEITGSGTSFVITNSHEPALVSVVVNKIWVDSDDAAGARPASITVHLLANGVDTGKTLTLGADGTWTATFEGLYKYENGSEIAYTVKEDAVDQYTSSVSGDAANGFTVTNTFNEQPDPQDPTNPDDPKDPENPDTPGKPGTLGAKTPGGKGSAPGGHGRFVPKTGDLLAVAGGVLVVIAVVCATVLLRKPKKGRHSL